MLSSYDVLTDFDWFKLAWIWQMPLMHRAVQEYQASQKDSLPVLRYPQFYIQLIFKPHFGTWILLFGLFRQLRAVRKKSGFEFFWATFEGGFCPQKVEKICCHSNFNPECNTERGYIDQTHCLYHWAFYWSVKNLTTYL